MSNFTSISRLSPRYFNFALVYTWTFWFLDNSLHLLSTPIDQFPISRHWYTHSRHLSIASSFVNFALLSVDISVYDMWNIHVGTFFDHVALASWFNGELLCSVISFKPTRNLSLFLSKCISIPCSVSSNQYRASGAIKFRLLNTYTRL